MLLGGHAHWALCWHEDAVSQRSWSDWWAEGSKIFPVSTADPFLFKLLNFVFSFSLISMCKTLKKSKDVECVRDKSLWLWWNNVCYLIDTPSRMWHLILGIWCPPMCVSWGILRSTRLVHRKLLYLVSSDMWQGVTNKQEEERLIGVCVGVWITFHRPIPAKEPIEKWLGSQILFRGDTPGRYVHKKKSMFPSAAFFRLNKFRQLLISMVFGMGIEI